MKTIELPKPAFYCERIDTFDEAEAVEYRRRKTMERLRRFLIDDTEEEIELHGAEV